MSTRSILQFGAPELRQKARPVNSFNKQLRLLIDEMAETLEGKEDGAALAAPQIGVLRRVVVISYENDYLELINPEIIAADGESTEYEGCLSFSGYVGLVRRSNSITLRYLTRNGNERVLERDGSLARCIQHEIDHLDGVLFVDRMVTESLVHSKTDMTISRQSVLDLSNGQIPQARENAIWTENGKGGVPPR